MQECLGCSLVYCNRNRFLPSLHDSVRAFSLGLAFVWYAKTLFVHAGNGQLVRYFSRTTHSLFLVLCAYMLVYAHVSMYGADAMPSSVVPPQLLHICLNVMSLLHLLFANSWLEFTTGHCEAPQRHSRNLPIASVSYHGPDKTSSARSGSQRVTKAHAVSPV